LARLHVSVGIQSHSHAAQPIGTQIRKDAVDRQRNLLPAPVVVRGRGGCGAAGRHFLQRAHIDGRGRDPSSDLLLDDSITFPIVEVADGGDRMAGGALPPGQAPLVVVGELRPGRREARTGGGIGGRAAGHVPRRIIAGGVAAADAGDGVQVLAISVGRAALWAAGEPVQGIVAEALSILG